MSAVLFFYLADTLNNAGIVFFLLGLVINPLCCFLLYGSRILSADDKETLPITLSGIKRCIIITSLFWLVAFFVPTKETMYLMAGASVVQDVANNPRVKELAGSSLDLIEKKIKEYSNDVSENGEKEKVQQQNDR